MSTADGFVVRYVVNRNTWHVHWNDDHMRMAQAAELRQRLQTMGVEARLRAEFQACQERLPARSALVVGGVHGCWTYCPADVASRVVQLLGQAAGVQPVRVRARRYRGRVR